MATSEKWVKIVTDIALGEVSPDTCAVVKNIPLDVTDENLINYLEVLCSPAGNKAVYHVEESSSIVLAIFGSKLDEQNISQKVEKKLLRNQKVTFNVMGFPRGIFIRNVPKLATEDTLTFYFEKVLRGKEEPVLSTKIFRERHIAVVELDNPLTDLPVILKKESHVVCSEKILLEPYYPMIHDDIITALPTNTSPHQINMANKIYQTENMTETPEQQLATYHKNLLGEIENTSLDIVPSPSYIHDGERSISEEDNIPPHKPLIGRQTSGNLRIFVGESNEQLSSIEHISLDSDVSIDGDIPSNSAKRTQPEVLDKENLNTLFPKQYGIKSNFSVIDTIVPENEGHFISDIESKQTTPLGTPLDVKKKIKRDITERQKEERLIMEELDFTPIKDHMTGKQKEERLVTEELDFTPIKDHMTRKQKEERLVTEELDLTPIKHDITGKQKEERLVTEELDFTPIKDHMTGKQKEERLVTEGLDFTPIKDHMTRKQKKERLVTEELDFTPIKDHMTGKQKEERLVTEELDFTSKYDNLLLLELANFEIQGKSHDCFIDIDKNRRKIIIKGKKKPVEVLILKHYEILNSVERLTQHVSENAAVVLRQDKSKEFIASTLISKSINALVTINDNNPVLQVAAFSRSDVKSALHIVTAKLIRNEVQYSESHYQFLNSEKWTSLVTSLEGFCKSMVKIEVVRDRHAILVEGFKVEVEQTVNDIQQVLKAHCDITRSVHLTGGEAVCFKRFVQDGQEMKDVYDCASKHHVSLKIRDSNGGNTISIEIKGKDDTMKIVESHVQRVLKDIWHGRLDFGRISREDRDKALISKGLLSKKGSTFIQQFEQQHKCIVEVHEGQQHVSVSSFIFVPASSDEQSEPTVTRAQSLPNVSEYEPWDEDQLHSPVSESPEILFSTNLPAASSATSITVGNTNIQVIQGDITKQKADVLVNVIPTPSLRVKDSAVYGAFVQAGGPELEQARKSSADRNVVYTEAGGDLDCNYVFHLLMEKWHDDLTKKNLKLALESCFEWCESLGINRIAFPAVGVGKYLKYPPVFVANCMISQAVNVAMQRNNIQNISFVIYDQTVLPEYQRCLQEKESGVSHLTSRDQALRRRMRRSETAAALPLQGVSIYSKLHESNTPQPRRSEVYPQKTDFRQRPPFVLQPPNASEKRHDRYTSRTAHHKDPLPDSMEKVKLATVQMYAESTVVGERARSELSKEIKARFLTEDEIGDSCIKFLSKDLKKSIYEIDSCKHKNVYVSINSEKSRIFLKGEKDEVDRTSKEIYKILLKINKNSPHGHDGSSPKKRRHQRGTKEYWRELTDDPPTPSYFKHFKKGLGFADFIRSAVGFQRFELEDVDSKTFKAVEGLIMKTWKNDFVGKGQDAKGLSHTSLKVQRIQRIENCYLYKNYALKRQEFFQAKAQSHGNVNQFKALEHVKQAQKGAVWTCKHMDARLMSDIWPEINEHYLFHGTPSEYIENIMKKGLDFRHGSDKAMFGPGTYAAESSTKADQYTDGSSGRQSKGKKMLLIRMLLGNMFVTSKPTKLKKPPCQCLKENCANSKHDEFHSVIGDGSWLFREFVVYSKDQCYPEYLITYDRVA